MMTTFGAPCGSLGSGHHGFDSAIVRPMTPPNSSPDGCLYDIGASSFGCRSLMTSSNQCSVLQSPTSGISRLVCLESKSRISRRVKRKWCMLRGIRVRWFVAAVACACVVAAILCNLALAQEDALSGDEAAQVKARVQKIRGLKLTSDVPVSYLSVAETESRFRTEFARETSQEEIDVGVEEGKMIGLYPPDLKIESKDLADVTRELAGFYDDRHKDIVIIDRPIAAAIPERYRGALTRYKKLDTAGVMGHELDRKSTRL